MDYESVCIYKNIYMIVRIGYCKWWFVGSWVHCGCHLTTSIVGPVIFSLPFALALLGWVPGVVCVAMAALVTFYAYNLLSAVLEHHAQQGKRLLRFRDMATHILGHCSATYINIYMGLGPFVRNFNNQPGAM